MEPSPVLPLLTFPLPRAFRASMFPAASQGQEDKTPLVPSLYNKTFGNLEGHRDKRLSFFFFLFSFFTTTNGGLSLPALLQSHTPIKEHEICQKPRQGRSVPPCGEFASLQDNQTAGRREAVCSVSHSGDLSPHPLPILKLCFLNVSALPLQAWHTDTTETGKDMEK